MSKLPPSIMSYCFEAVRDAAPRASHAAGSSELTQVLREFTVLIRQRRRENLTDVEIARLRSLLHELTRHLHGLTPQP
jgi:hypothetical protein